MCDTERLLHETCPVQTRVQKDTSAAAAHPPGGPCHAAASHLTDR